MSRWKHKPEWIIARVQEYLSGKVSYDTIAKANGIGSTTLKDWARKYREQGSTAFAIRCGNADD